MARYYLGIDWGDQSHGVWACEESGRAILDRMVPHTWDGLSELRRWLHEARAAGAELWAAIEKPHRRMVDFLLDCGVVVYPVNPAGNEKEKRG